MQTGFDAILLKECVNAEDMVEVAMRAEHMAQSQAMLIDVVDKGLALLFEQRAAVDDCRLLRLVAHHVAVLLHGVYLKSFDIH